MNDPFANAAKVTNIRDLKIGADGFTPRAGVVDPVKHEPMCWRSRDGRDAPAREWAWDGILPRGHVTTLFGDGGVGKSLFAQQLATYIATGCKSEWCGRELSNGPVMGLFAEDDEDELWRRQEEINFRNGLNMPDLDELHIESGYGLDNLLMTFDKSAGDQRPLLHWYRERCERIKPKLLIVDNIADTFGGDEVKRLHVNQFLKTALGGLAREHNCAVLLLGHPSISGMASGNGMSGSTAWSNGVRSRLYMRRLETDEEGFTPDTRAIDLMKANYAAKGDSIRVRWAAGIFDHVPHDVIPQPTSMDAMQRRNLVVTALRESDRCWREPVIQLTGWQ